MARHNRSDPQREARAANFAATLADALHELHITHNELAGILSLNINTVNSWTRGTNPALPSGENIERLAMLLERRKTGLGKRLTTLVASPTQTPLLATERTTTRAGEQANLRAPATNLTQDLYVSTTLKTGRVMVKDEDVCLHCGLCAERCPTGAWDMHKFLLNVTHAGPAARSPQRKAA